MPWVRCPQERDYQHALAVILRRIREEHGPHAELVPFPPQDHNLLALIAWPVPLDGFYLISERERWGDDISDEARIRAGHDVFFCWHNQEFHDLLRPKRRGLYLEVPIEEKMFAVPRYLCVPTPPVAAYYTGVMLAEGRMPFLIRTVLQVEWAVLAFFSFLYAARDGLRMQLKFYDWRLAMDRAVSRCRA
ncbi:hypothetical protein FGB62_103g013 [Gracilaria domingensis]|nr:hypothetical protein FGB62_103g013 [Gracilaria domingensis]